SVEIDDEGRKGEGTEIGLQANMLLIGMRLRAACIGESHPAPCPRQGRFNSPPPGRVLSTREPTVDARARTLHGPRSIRSSARPPRRGLSIVQDPGEALHASMPCTAIRDDDVDAVLKLHDLAAAIVDLANGEMVDVKPPEARAAS